MTITKESIVITTYQDVEHEGKLCRLENTIKIRKSITGKYLAQIVRRRYIPIGGEND